MALKLNKQCIFQQKLKSVDPN